MVQVRAAVAADRIGWERLWAAYLDFYQVRLQPEMTALTWERVLERPDMGLLLAEAPEGGLLGFALWVTHPTSWRAEPDLYLEDLFVDAAARGTGAGRALIEGLKAMGRARGCGRIYWMTETGNATARRLYDRVAEHDGHIRYRTAL